MKRPTFDAAAATARSGPVVAHLGGAMGRSCRPPLSTVGTARISPMSSTFNMHPLRNRLSSLSISTSSVVPMAKLWDSIDSSGSGSLLRSREDASQSKRPMLPGEFDVFGQSDDPTLDSKVMIDGYTEPNRFSVNGVLLPGPLFLLPDAVFEWRVSSLDDLSPQSLALAHAVHPRVSILLIGCGRKTKLLDPALRDFFRGKGVVIEALDTWNAIATWNILNQEDRAVAAALLPFNVE